MFSFLWEAGSDGAPPPSEGREGAVVVREAVGGDRPSAASALGNAPLRSRGRGRGAGYQHSDLTRQRMKTARAQRQTRDARVDAAAAMGVLCPPRAQEVARVAFGGSKLERSDIVMVEGQAFEVARDGHDDHHRRACVDRGFLSHLRAQALGIAVFWAPSPTRAVDHALSFNMFGDAGMWVAKPASEPGALEGEFGARLAAWAGRRGNNAHMPVLNLCETLFIRAESTAPASQEKLLLGCEIHSPAQVLPAANATTIHQRWGQWSVMTTRGPGALVSSGSDLAEISPKVPWRTMVLVRDNLVANDCIVALGEQSLQRAQASLAGGQTDADITLMSVPCTGHSVVLAMKPLVASLDDLPGKLVKLGHLLESGAHIGGLPAGALQDRRVPVRVSGVLGASARGPRLAIACRECVGARQACS